MCSKAFSSIFRLSLVFTEEETQKEAVCRLNFGEYSATRSSGNFFLYFIN